MQHEGVKQVAQDKNQVKNSEETTNESQTEHNDANDIPRMPKETGGPKGPEPTRYGDWERKGRCIDF